MAVPARLQNFVKAYRTRLGWSQADLARHSGLSRAGISAIELGRLIPSAAAALTLAHVLRCRVEDLFQIPASTGDQANPAWAWPPTSATGRYWLAEVAGRALRFPVEQTPLGLIPHDGIATTSGQNAAPHSAPPTLVLACCDPAVGLLASEFMRESGIRLLILERSSGKALHLLKQGLVHVAGVHLASVADQGGNKRHVRRLIGPGYELLRAASWDEGIAVSEGLRSFSIDRATRPGIRWVGRDPGSGARRCLEQLFGDRPLPRRVAHDHRGVSALIRGGWADAGVCLRFVSQEAGLPFHPLRTEPYELCFPESASDDPRIQRLIEVVRSPAYRRLIAELPGYDTKDTGNIEHVTAKS